jgi:hypothetical protein
LLPAKSAPYTVVFRRKPTDCFHVLRWNTETDQIEHGAWFAGTIYPKRADVSFDGNWLVFLAMDPGAATFNRVSSPPLLNPVVEVESTGTYRGGGYWETQSLLRLHGWFTFREGKQKVQEALPFAVENYEEELGELGVLYRRLARDGWYRVGDNWGIQTEIQQPDYGLNCIGDDGWQSQPTPAHPALRMVNTGYRYGTHHFKFWLAEFPTLINDKADWACWDSLGQLLFSHAGAIYKYGLDDIYAGTPKTVIDLEHLTPP